MKAANRSSKMKSFVRASTGKPEVLLLYTQRLSDEILTTDTGCVLAEGIGVSRKARVHRAVLAGRFGVMTASFLQSHTTKKSRLRIAPAPGFVRRRSLI
jgi:hypothetical protein